MYGKRITYILCIFAVIFFVGCNTKDTLDHVNNNLSKDGDFKLAVYSDKNKYKENTPIKLWATLEYMGENDQIDIWYDEPIIKLSIYGEGNDFEWKTLSDLLLRTRVMNKNKEISESFKMPEGSIDDIDNEELKKFLENSELQLPSGSYKIIASTDFYMDKECTENIKISTEITIKVY